MRWVQLLLLAALCVAPCERARADPFHAQTLPLGQRATGMGGAFTAVASDPSAVFYNPAGIAVAGGSALSASLTLYAFDRSTVESGYRTATGHSSLDHAAGASLPVFVSAVTQIGKKDKDGRRHHAIAISTFTYEARHQTFDVEVRSMDSTNKYLDTLSIDNTDRSLWNALSYAYRPTARLAFGISGILSIYRGRHTEEHITARLADVPPSGAPIPTDENEWTSHLTTVDVKSLLVRLGMLYIVNEKLRLGLMVQPPSLHVRGQARVRERALRTSLTGTPTSTYFTAEDGDVAARRPIPLELRIGGSYALYSWLLLSLDTSLYGRTGSKQNPVVAIGPRQADSTTGAFADPGTFYAETWYRRWSGNLAIGAEATLRESIAVRAGLYTDLSSAPPVPATADKYAPPDVQRVGGTLSIGLVQDNYDISIGAIGLYGRGKGLSYETSQEGPAQFQRTTVTDRMFLVFVNGVRSAVSAIAKKTNEKLQEVRKTRQSADPDARDEPRK